jgi:hypothetical protein
MSDTYQAIYQATKDSLRNCDVGQTVRECLDVQLSDLSHAVACIKQEMLNAALDMQQPSVVYRPKLSKDGSQWCALYGENLQDGVAGFGDTPALAMQNFNKAWVTQ